MRAALILAAYAVMAAWIAPVPLARLTNRGISPRLGLGAWLAVMLSPLVSAGLAFYSFSRTPQANLPLLTHLLCREVAGNACTPQVYRSELYQLGATTLMIMIVGAALTAAWRWGRKVQRSRRRTLAHGRAARLVGRPLYGQGMGGQDVAGAAAVVLEDPRPAAYCAAGTIVVTRGALDVLDDAQLAVVLAHERGHLRGRHHALCLMTRGLTAAFPGIPLFAAGERAVSRLAEMSADDSAVRRGEARSGSRVTLISALVAIATGEAVPIPRTALAAASHEVQARVERLLCAPAHLVILAHMAALTALTLAVAALPAVVLAATT